MNIEFHSAIRGCTVRARISQADWDRANSIAQQALTLRRYGVNRARFEAVGTVASFTGYTPLRRTGSYPPFGAAQLSESYGVVVDEGVFYLTLQAYNPYEALPSEKWEIPTFEEALCAPYTFNL